MDTYASDQVPLQLLEDISDDVYGPLEAPGVLRDRRGQDGIQVEKQDLIHYVASIGALEGSRGETSVMHAVTLAKNIDFLFCRHVTIVRSTLNGAFKESVCSFIYGGTESYFTITLLPCARVRAAQKAQTWVSKWWQCSHYAADLYPGGGRKTQL